MDEVLREFSELNNPRQIIIFILFVLIGATFCVIYDFIRSVRGRIKKQKVFTFISDVLYILFFTLVIYLALLVECDGEIRIFALLGCLLGWIAIRLTLSPLIYKIITKVLSVIIGIFALANIKIVMPIGRKIPVFRDRIKDKIKVIINKQIKYSKKDKKHLQKDRKVLYNQKDRESRRKNTRKSNEVQRSERNTYY